MRRLAGLVVAVLSASLVLAAGLSAQQGSSCEGAVATIVGGGGSDNITGTAGNDVIDGRGGDDTIDGAGGSDRICGAGGDDVLTGGDGNDVLSGGEGTDTLGGAGGDDVLLGGSGADALNGGPGANDLAAYNDRTQAVGVDIDGAADDGEGGEGDNVAADVENIVGGGGNDNLVGDSDANSIRGGDGVDTIAGNEGNDILDGDAGSDMQLRGGPGNDTLLGDAGDELLFGNAGNDTITGGLGNDTLNGGDGADILKARDGFDDAAVACGPPDRFTLPFDLAEVDLRDSTISDCEVVSRSDRREGPTVRISPRATRVSAGRVPVRLSCPRALPRSCAGRLTLAGVSPKVSIGSARYRIRDGRTGTVGVPASPRSLALLRRRGRLGVRATAVERGRHGTKTTIQALLVRAR